MKWRNLGIVAAVFLALGAWVYFYEIKGEKKREESAEREKALFHFESKDIASVEISSASGSIVLQQEKDGWKLKQPMEAKADATVASALGNDIAAARIDQTVEEANPLWKTYGLDPAALKLRVKLNDGKTQELELGDKDFSGASVYARIPGQNKVLMVGASLLASSTKSAFDFRDKSLLEFKRDDVSQIQIISKDKTYRFEKMGSDWLIKEPISASATGAEIDSLLGDLEAARADEFVDNPDSDLKTYGLNPPEFRLNLWAGSNNAQKSLLVGKKVDTFCYAKDEARPAIFKIKEDLLHKLAPDLQQIRDKRMLHLDREKITQVEIKLKDKAYAFFRGSDRKWKMSQPEGYRGKYISEYRLFWPLEDLEAKEFVDKANLKDPQYGFSQPEFVIRIKDKDNQVTELVAGKLNQDLLPVKLNGGPVVYKVEKKVLDDLNFKVDELVEK